MGFGNHHLTRLNQSAIAIDSCGDSHFVLTTVLRVVDFYMGKVGPGTVSSSSDLDIRSRVLYYRYVHVQSQSYCEFWNIAENDG